MSPQNADHASPAAAGSAGVNYPPSGLRRFRKQDLIDLPLVGVALGAALIAGKWLVARWQGAAFDQLASPMYVLEHLALGVGLATVMAALQTRRDGITMASTLLAWLAIVVGIAAIAMTSPVDRASLARDTVVVVATLGAALWLHQRRR